MTQHVGGLRARLIHDNLFNMLHDGLAEIGWLDANRQHKPIHVRKTQVGREEKVEPNIVCISADDVKGTQAELGSELTDNEWYYYIDVYAEDSTLGLHLGTDVRDLLSGKYTSTVSRPGPDISIYDLTMQSATPIELFVVEIQNVDLNRSRFYEKPFQENWWVISFTVLDTYATEDN